MEFTIEREQPVTLASLHQGWPGGVAPQFPSDPTAPPAFVIPPPVSAPVVAPVSPAPMNISPPPPSFHPMEDNSSAIAGSWSPFKSSSEPVEFRAFEDGRVEATVLNETFDISPQHAMEIISLLLEGYGYHVAGRINKLGSTFGLWPVAAEGKTRHEGIPAERVVPEVPTETPTPNEQVPVANEAGTQMWPMPYVSAGTRSALPEVLGGETGAIPSTLDPRHGSPRGYDGAEVSAFGSLHGHLSKPTHLVEAGREAISGPTGLFDRLREGEHATDGRKPERRKGKRRKSARKGNQAADAPGEENRSEQT